MATATKEQSTPAWVIVRHPQTQAKDWKQLGGGWVHRSARVGDDATVGDYATVGVGARVGDNARVRNNARVNRLNSYCLVGVGSEPGTLLIYWHEDDVIVNRGCFTGTEDEFMAKVALKPATCPYRRQYELVVPGLCAAIRQQVAALNTANTPCAPAAAPAGEDVPAGAGQ